MSKKRCTAHMTYPLPDRLHWDEGDDGHRTPLRPIIYPKFASETARDKADQSLHPEEHERRVEEVGTVIAERSAELNRRLA